MLSITLRQLEYAVAVARTGGVTAAAEALNVSQPALSVALSQLEAQIGQPLFLRRAGSAVTPTGYGRGFLEEAERILASLARLTSGATAHARTARRHAIALNALIDGLWLEISLGGDDFSGDDIVRIALDGTAAILGIDAADLRGH